MKYLIAIALMIIAALTINAHFVNENKWQKEAIAAWNDDMQEHRTATSVFCHDVDYEPPILDSIRYFEYYQRQNKHYREEVKR